MDKSRNIPKVLSCLCLTGTLLNPGQASANHTDWVVESNEYSELVTQLFGKYVPELLTKLGDERFDESIRQYPLDSNELARKDETLLIATLEKGRREETDPAVLQDIDILIHLLDLDIELTDVEESLMLPYFDLAKQVYTGLRPLLDAQVSAERREFALVRLRKYTGLDNDLEPLGSQIETYVRARLDDPGLLGPFKGEIETDLALAPRIADGLGKMFAQFEIPDYEEPLEILRQQIEKHAEFIQAEVLPRAREDFRLPPELYALRLQEIGIDMPIPELTSRARTSFREIQNEMQALAVQIAKQRDFASTDYRDVIRELKEEQLAADEIVDFYQETIKSVEAIIREQEVVTLPSRVLQVRIANEAEEAVIRAATIRWPNLLGDAAEVGEIILPVRRPKSDPADDLKFDDFTHRSAAWSLVIHEGRPGHELQMASIMEKGVSTARAFYAFNSTNVEGWALYVEAVMKPYLPLDAQLISLQHRLLRAARAFLDPGLQSGEITTEQAARILFHDVVLSAAVVDQELERYTSDSPGQATSYFCGYQRLTELRARVELLQGDTFNQKAFHNFILGQGLLPPSALSQAVMKDFVGSGDRSDAEGVNTP